jgi:hypothetical protein
LSGCSFLFEEKFITGYNFKNFILYHVLLDEEIPQITKRIGISENGNLKLNFPDLRLP